MRSSDAGKNPNIILIVVYAMTQIGMFPLIFANELAAPGRNRELYSCFTRIEDKLQKRAFDVFEALDRLKTPGDDHNAAIQKLKSNIDIEYLREIYSCARLDVRKIFRLHYPDLFADLSEEEKRDLANKLDRLGLGLNWHLFLESIKDDSASIMALDRSTVPGDEHDVAIDVVIEVLCRKGDVSRTILRDLSEDVKKIMLSHPSFADLSYDNPNKPNSKRSRLSRRFP